MDFADEHYVKLFTRDTVTWRAWPWQARAVFPALMRAVDHAGLLSVGTREPVRSIALMVMMPEDVVGPAFEALCADGTMELVNGHLVIPRFLEAQESRKTNTQSKREQREKAKAVVRAAEVLKTSSYERQTAADDGRSGHPSAQLSPSSSPAQPSPDVRAGVLPVSISPPTTDPTAWLAEDFWRWAQSRRQAAGFTPEKLPHGRKLSDWYSSWLSTLNGDVERLQEAFLSFGDDPYWQKPKQPPALPFAGFMSQTERFVPRGEHAP